MSPNLRYDVRMRASEEHRSHDEETRQLISALEQKDRQLAEVMAAEPGGTAAMENRTVLVSHNKDVKSASEAVVEARKALDEHVKKSTHFVRNYRIIDPNSGADLDSFTVDYEVAPWAASKRMAGKQISHYDLQEQQPDGTWLPYYPD